MSFAERVRLASAVGRGRPVALFCCNAAPPVLAVHPSPAPHPPPVGGQPFRWQVMMTSGRGLAPDTIKTSVLSERKVLRGGAVAALQGMLRGPML